MVEYYDPDRPRSGAVGRSDPPSEVRVQRPTSGASPSLGRPVLELIIVGLAVALVVATSWTQWGAFDSVMFGLQVLYPLASALFTGAVAALLVRRALRRQHATLVAAIEPLHDELATLRAEVGGTSRG